MKRLPLLLFIGLTSGLNAEPRLTSWHTGDDGKYARIFETIDDEQSGTSVTTWSRGQGTQSLPTYGGVHEISHTSTDVYVRSTGLATHLMGPWYLDAAKNNLFPNYPANQAVIYRVPKDPGSPPPDKTLTGLGRIGLFVNGVSMFDSRDAFSYDTSAAQDDGPNADGVTGDSVWNRDAFVNESVTFDAANAHQGRSNYHYHANPPALRHQLGDSVDYDSAANRYTENPNGSHSPILAWVADGYLLYGPYGYSDPSDPASDIVRMRSGFQKRSLTARTTLPAYAARDQNRSATLPAEFHGPAISTQIPIGHYLEDYEYLGDLGQTLGGDFDLDEHNGRFCITPEFPEGTYAYFVAIEPDGTPKFPYNIGRSYYGNPTGGVTPNIPADATISYQGGPERPLASKIEASSDEVTLTWSTVEGGTYVTESSDNLDKWDLISPTQSANQNTLTDAPPANRNFFRSTRIGLAPFDETGFVLDNLPAQPMNNILLIIVDDWGIDSSPLDNPGASGHASMPNLAAMAAQGVRFTNAYAQPTCSPTRANIMTGRYSFRHGIGSPGGANLPASETTLPEVFTAASSPYALTAIGKWHLGGGDTGPGDLGGWPDYHSTLNAQVDSYTSWIKTINGVSSTVTTYATTDQVNDAIAFTQNPDPWFCWLALNAPHSPFEEPPAELILSGSTGGGNRSLYERTLEAMDTEIGRLLETIDLNKTNVFLIGDNGTPGNVVLPPYIQGRTKGTLYEGGIKVPFIALGPDIRARGTCDEPVHCADLFATILDLSGLTLPENTDSRSLFPALNGSGNFTGGVVLEAFGNGVTDPGRAIRLGDYKLIQFDSGLEEFYHVSSDPTELTDLLPDLTPEEQTAYNAIIARNAELTENDGGDFSIDATGIVSISPASGTPGQTVTLTIEFEQNHDPAVPGLNLDIASINLGGILATDITRPSRFVAEATFILPTTSDTYDIEAIFTGPQMRTFGIQNGFTVTP